MAHRQGRNIQCPQLIQASIPHFSSSVNPYVDKSVLPCPHFSVFFRAFKMVHDYWCFSH